MNDESDIITTDNPLSSEQKAKLAGLLDAIIPPGEDGRMPGASELDLIAYIQKQAAEFIPALIQLLDELDDQFAVLEPSQRHPVVEELSKSRADLFGPVLFHTFACYYQDDSVLEGLGMGAGPPFPRGNTVDSGDLSLLDPVIQNPKAYRKT